METRWLRSMFQESEYDAESPQPKRVKFSELSDELQGQFPDQKYSPYTVSKIIHEAFPSTQTKTCGKIRSRHILGLERKPAESPGPSHSASPSPSITDPTSRITDLLIENQILRNRIKELEKASADSLCQQADQITHHKSMVTDGPNSLDTFSNFSLDSIISELQSRAPELYQLCMNQVKDEVTGEQVKAVSALCSLLNARSARVN